MSDDVFVRDSNNDLAVNTVVSTEANVPYNYDDCFTVDTNGRRALRVVGSGGGGDQHNLGYYTTQTALEEAYPTAEAGDWAIVGSTDTVWIWDTDTSAWKDSDQKGQVTSVNGKTGAVNLSAWDINALLQSSTAPEASIENLGKIYQMAGTDTTNDGTFWKCVADSRVISTGVVDITSFTGSIADTPLPTVNLVDTNAFDTFLQTYCEGATISQVDPLIAFEIVADEDEQGAFVSFTCNSGNIGGWLDLESLTLENILAALTEMGFSVTLNGDTGFATLDGKLPFTAGTIHWKQIDVQPTPDPLPDQTGNAGKFLTTDGTDASWSDKPLVNTTTANSAIGIGSGTVNSNCVSVGYNTYCFSNGVTIGYAAKITGIGHANSIAIGYQAQVQAANAIQLGGGVSPQTNSDANTMKVANANGNFEIMSADGTVPTARLTKVNTTLTLSANGWSSNTQTISVAGITTTGVVLVSPIPADQADYTSAGIICSAQAAGSLEFTCTNTPTNDIDVVVVML